MFQRCSRSGSIRQVRWISRSTGPKTRSSREGPPSYTLAMYRPSSGAVTPMTTMSAMSCAQPAAVIRTAPGTARQPPGTGRAGSPGRDRRCSRRSRGYAYGATLRIDLWRGRSELVDVVRSDDAVAAAHQPDAQREEPNDQEQYPHISHGSPRVGSGNLDVYAALDAARRGLMPC